MLRTTLVVFAAAFGLLGLNGECQAQVGFRSQPAFFNTGGTMNVAPIATNSNRYARLGMSVGVSQLVDVYTFTPVRGYPVFVPINPSGIPLGAAGFNSGYNPGYNRWSGGIGRRNVPTLPKPIASRFVDAAWKFDVDKNARLNREELEKLAVAAVTELKQTPATYEKLKRGAQANKKPGQLITEKDVTEVFLAQCLNFDRDKDNTLNPHETDVMAAALIKFLR